MPGRYFTQFFLLRVLFRVTLRFSIYLSLFSSVWAQEIDSKSVRALPSQQAKQSQVPEKVPSSSFPDTNSVSDSAQSNLFSPRPDSAQADSINLEFYQKNPLQSDSLARDTNRSDTTITSIVGTDTILSDTLIKLPGNLDSLKEKTSQRDTSNSHSLNSSIESEPSPSSSRTSNIPDSTRVELNEERVITKTNTQKWKKEASRIVLTREQMRKVAATQGDPMRVLQTLPGIQAQNDLSVKPLVRGGKSDETRVFWDGIPLIQPYHFGSIYSVFNMEAVDSLTLYTGGFPAGGANALSGALYVASRPAPLDSLRLFTDLSLLRGHVYLGVPLVTDKIGIYVAAQSFWYDWVVDRSMDALELIIDDKSFSRNRRDFDALVDLPNFRDLEFGIRFKPEENINLNYAGWMSQDRFSVKEPQIQYFVDDDEVSPEYFQLRLAFPNDPKNKLERLQLYDTLAIIEIQNQLHSLSGKWNPDNKWQLEASLAWQKQHWNVGFFDSPYWDDSLGPNGEYHGEKRYGQSPNYYQHEKEAWFGQVKLSHDLWVDHHLETGISLEKWEQHYDTHLQRPIYELIVNGNQNLLDALGYYNPEGFVIKRNSIEDLYNVDFLQELPYRIRFDYSGQQSQEFASAWLQDQWIISSSRFARLGLRGEYEYASGNWWLSPRMSLHESFAEKDQLTFAAGLYAQNDLPFYVREQNPKIGSEKAWHFQAEWTRYISKSIRLEWQNYYKYYFDLVSPRLQSTGRINWENGFGNIDSTEFEALNPVLKAVILPYLSDKEFQYSNEGIGFNAGSELSLFYKPDSVWEGWVSGELAYSRRQDHEGERWYKFTFSRPWAINWVNWYHAPSNWDVGLRYKIAAGEPYTDFSNPLNSERDETSDTAFWAGARNEKEYTPYNRVDIRLVKNSLLFGGKTQYYFEIWNAFNSPNFLLQDSESKKIKYFQLNYPFPIVFIGLNWRW